jgi:hypothetical protein
LIRILSLAAAVSLGLAAGAADAKTCRDAAGKFISCQPAPVAQKACRDAAGHFAKCPAPMAAAAPAARSAVTAGRPASTTAPAGAAPARCKDGSLSYSQHRSGTCAGHGGVATWM